MLRKPTWGRGRSSDMRPSARARDSSGPSKMFPKLGRAFMGRGGSGEVEDWRFSMFSKWLRSDDTGFYNAHISYSSAEVAGDTHDGGAIGALRLARRFLHGCSVRQQHKLFTGGLQRTHAPSLGDYNDRNWPERRERIGRSGDGSSSMPSARELEVIERARSGGVGRLSFEARWA